MTKFATNSADGLTLNLEDGVVAHNMGEGIVAFDQMDEETKSLQRVILTRGHLEAVLSWGN